MVLLVVLVVAIALFFPHPSPLAIPPPVLYLGTPSISGNRTSGWAFLIPVHLESWVGPGQMPWLNVTFRLMNDTSGGQETAYSPPGGTTLRVFPPSGNVSPFYALPVAMYNLSTRSWESGGSQAIEDGEWLILQGMIPPGQYSGHYVNDGPFGTYSGPSLVFTAAFGRAIWTMPVFLGS